MRDNARRTGPAIEAHYQFLNWLVPAIARFPREQRFLLGDRIQSIALDCPAPDRDTRDQVGTGPSSASVCAGRS